MHVYTPNTYACIHTHMQQYTCICVYTHYKYIHACTYTCIQEVSVVTVSIFRIQVYSFIYVYAFMYTHTIFIDIYVYTRIYVYTHNIHTYSLMYMHLCIHTQYSYIFIYTRVHTGWRRPIRCLILWITFRKLATNYRALLRKMTQKDKASYESLPPCKRGPHGHSLNLSYSNIYMHIHAFMYTPTIFMNIHKYSHLHTYTHTIFIHIHVYIHAYRRHSSSQPIGCYGVASVSRIDKIIGLFCKRAL